MESPDSMRDFSVVKHARGDWDTTVSRTRLPLLRQLYTFISFKRELIERCARRAPQARVAIEIGCGTGAYSEWFKSANPATTVVAIDWSYNALVRLRCRAGARILAVCADARMLPIKPACADAVFSVDTMGHVPTPHKMLNEILRIMHPRAVAALHSECADYRSRWPDRVLLKRLGRDIPAEQDGHCALLHSGAIRSLLCQRFTVSRFYSPAGILGWLCGYPEKYAPAFSAASRPVFWLLCQTAATIKRTPLLGVLLRFFNISTNRLELFFGLEGGGSCFAEFTRPESIEQ